MADDVKAVEALYNLTKAAYDAEISRYDATEAKAGRYLTVLGLVIGAFVIKFDDVLWVWDSAPVARWVAVLFLLAYATTVSCALVAFGSSIVAMSVKDVSAIPVGEEMEQLFAKHDYKDALEATTESFRTATRKLRETTEDRVKHVHRTNKFLKAMLIAGAVSLLVYFPIKVSARNAVQKTEESTMADNATPSASQDTTQTKPAAKPKPPTFETVKRDAGDIIQKK